MASISTDKSGNRKIQFVDPVDGRRRTIYLGDIAKRDAERFKLRLESLISAKAHGSPVDPELASWLESLGEDVHAKLAGVGLASPRESRRATMKAFLDGLRERGGLKESTRLALRTAHKRIVEFFGASKPVSDVTRADADDFQSWLREKEYAGGTIARTLKHAKAAFRRAVRTKMRSENPFDDMKLPSSANPGRMEFVSKETIEKVIAACPNATWRAVFAFARYCGVRIPSEIFPLTWADVLWAEGRFASPLPRRSTTKARASGGFPSSPNCGPTWRTSVIHVFDRAKLGHDNLGVNARRIIRRAGVAPWAKTFVNLRSSRETELMAEFPAHVVVSWIGNSLAIAQKHYLQVTDADFAKASRPDAESDAREAQKPTQQESASDSTASQEKQKSPENPGFLQDRANPCDSLRPKLVGVIGLEPMTPSVSKWTVWMANWPNCSRNTTSFHCFYQQSGTKQYQQKNRRNAIAWNVPGNFVGTSPPASPERSRRDARGGRRTATC